MIKVLYFARLREELETGSESVENCADVGSLIAQLAARGGKWAEFFAKDQLVMVSVNQEMADADTQIKEDDEVAFFPPVTGG